MSKSRQGITESDEIENGGSDSHSDSKRLLRYLKQAQRYPKIRKSKLFFTC